MMALLGISILYDVDIINDSFTLLCSDGLKVYKHIPNELLNLYVNTPQILGHFCGRELIYVKEKTNG